MIHRYLSYLHRSAVSAFGNHSNLTVLGARVLSRMNESTRLGCVFLYGNSHLDFPLLPVHEREVNVPVAPDTVFVVVVVLVVSLGVC